ncbi:g9008 [Coccomyxa elongata]
MAARAAYRFASRASRHIPECMPSTSRCSAATGRASQSQRAAGRAFEQTKGSGQPGKSFSTRRNHDNLLRRRALLTQLPNAVTRALARQTSLIIFDWQGDDT